MIEIISIIFLFIALFFVLIYRKINCIKILLTNLLAEFIYKEECENKNSKISPGLFCKGGIREKPKCKRPNPPKPGRKN